MLNFRSQDGGKSKLRNGDILVSIGDKNVEWSSTDEIHRLWKNH